MVVYVCSPYRSECEVQFELQLEYTKAVSREIVLAGHEAITPHLFYPRFLDDNDEKEREAGMASALRILDSCDAIIVNTQYGYSEGMKAEVLKAGKIRDMTSLVSTSIENLKNILKVLDKK